MVIRNNKNEVEQQFGKIEMRTSCYSAKGITYIKLTLVKLEFGEYARQDIVNEKVNFISEHSFYHQ